MILLGSSQRVIKLPSIPTELPFWATTLHTNQVNQDGQIVPNRQSPPDAYKQDGLAPNEPMTRQWMNHQLWLLGNWIDYLRNKGLTPETALQLVTTGHSTHEFDTTETAVPFIETPDPLQHAAIVDTAYGVSTGVHLTRLTYSMSASVTMNMAESGTATTAIIAVKVAPLADVMTKTNFQTIAVKTFVSSSTNEGTLILTLNQPLVTKDSVFIMTTQKEAASAAISFNPDTVMGYDIPSIQLKVNGTTIEEDTP